MATISNQKPQAEKQALVKSLAITALVTVALLGLLLAATFIVPGMNWGKEDFAAAALLFSGTGIAWIAGSWMFKTTRSRIVVGLALAFSLLLIWTELAVGIFH